jgi:hypothetical protein
MQLAFRRGGRKAIDKVMKQQPAVFLKLLVLLVPREMKVEHSQGVKAMTDEQLEAGIEAIQRMLEARARGDQARSSRGSPSRPRCRRRGAKVKRKVRKSDQSMGTNLVSADDSANS